MNTQFTWTGRTDPEDGDLAKRWHQIVTQDHDKGAAAALVGFACELGVQRNKGRIGAEKGADVIRAALANMAWQGEGAKIADYGNVVPVARENDPLEQAQSDLGDRVAKALKACSKTLVLGGGHETAAGSFDGLLKYLGTDDKSRIGIINLDAHFDLRKPGEAGVSSGTPFYQIHEMLKARGQEMRYLCLGVAEISNTKALFERSREWNVQYMLDRDVRAHVMDGVYARIDGFLKDCDLLYLTIDLDVLPHWQMPAVSAPAPYGVGLDVIEDIVDYLGSKQINWPLSDVVEFNPSFDTDGRGAKVAARLCDKIMRTMIA